MDAPLPVRIAAWTLAITGILGALVLWQRHGVAAWVDAVIAFCV